MRKLRLAERQYGGSVHGAGPKFNFIMNRSYSVKTYFSVLPLSKLQHSGDFPVIQLGQVIRCKQTGLEDHDVEGGRKDWLNGKRDAASLDRT
jgi:hypothetical protein